MLFDPGVLGLPFGHNVENANDPERVLDRRRAAHVVDVVIFIDSGGRFACMGNDLGGTVVIGRYVLEHADHPVHVPGSVSLVP